MELVLRPATIADAALLAAMNRQLADDERSRNTMNVAALTERMAQWLAGEWQGIVIEQASTPIGYAVYQVGKDYYDPSIPEVYIKQFFIARDRRQQGLGRRAFQQLIATIFPPHANIHLDVLAANPAGQRFWESLGFAHLFRRDATFGTLTRSVSEAEFTAPKVRPR